MLRTYHQVSGMQPTKLDSSYFLLVSLFNHSLHSIWSSNTDPFESVDRSSWDRAGQQNYTLTRRYWWCCAQCSLYHGWHSTQRNPTSLCHIMGEMRSQIGGGWASYDLIVVWSDDDGVDWHECDSPPGALLFTLGATLKQEKALHSLQARISSRSQGDNY